MRSGTLAPCCVVITGASAGIGLELARVWAARSARLVLGARDAENLAAARNALVGSHPALQVEFVVGDVVSPNVQRELVERAQSRFGRLDVLVNNAAFQVHTSDFEDLTPEHFDETVRTNLYGYFHMAQAAVAVMAPGSAIVNTGSVTGIEGSKDLIDYSMTKGGIHAFTRALSGSLIRKGIRVNAVAPGPVWTPLNPSDKAAGQVAHFGSGAKMKRPAQPEEIAPAYVFLASPQCSSYITGEILPIIGGY